MTFTDTYVCRQVYAYVCMYIFAHWHAHKKLSLQVVLNSNSTKTPRKFLQLNEIFITIILCMYVGIYFLLGFCTIELKKIN